MVLHKNLLRLRHALEVLWPESSAYHEEILDAVRAEITIFLAARGGADSLQPLNFGRLAAMAAVQIVARATASDTITAEPAHEHIITVELAIRGVEAQEVLTKEFSSTLTPDEIAAVLARVACCRPTRQHPTVFLGVARAQCARLVRRKSLLSSSVS